MIMIASDLMYVLPKQQILISYISPNLNLISEDIFLIEKAVLTTNHRLPISRNLDYFLNVSNENPYWDLNQVQRL